MTQAWIRPPGIDEVRPGNYVFFDTFQATLGSCRVDEIAFSVLATVIGAYPERHEVVVDAGALALSKDPGPTHLDSECGFGIVRKPNTHQQATQIGIPQSKRAKTVTVFRDSGGWIAGRTRASAAKSIIRLRS